MSEPMGQPKQLIVNADDFGFSVSVNQGIIKAHEHGIVTSASLMVRWPAAEAAAAYARAHPQLSVGLHLDLGEWRFTDETWRPAYEVVPPDDAAALADEVARQLDAFSKLVARPPSHLDSHQHAHHSEPLHSIAVREARRLGIPLRQEGNEVRYCGEFYGQSNKGDPYHEGITVEALLKILGSLGPGTTELGCHPGAEGELESVYRLERILERQTLCDPRVRAAIAEQEIVLCSFSNRNRHGTESRTR